MLIYLLDCCMHNIVCATMIAAYRRPGLECTPGIECSKSFCHFPLALTSTLIAGQSSVHLMVIIQARNENQLLRGMLLPSLPLLLQQFSTHYC